jgi:endonuclease G
MAQNLLQFSGPVTINMSGPAAVAPAQPSPADAARSVTSDGQEPSFREKALRFDEDYNGRSAYGYKEDFLEGWKVPAPTLSESHDGAPVLDDEGKPWVIPYYHYSLIMNQKRRLLAWAASNVDYSDDARRYTKTRKEYGGESWRLDPRVALRVPGLQIVDAEFYAPATKIDRGHIVRREDCAHGRTAREAEYGNSDTYHWTNCTPQSEGFNQASKSGLWGQFEEHIRREVTAVGGRMSVFAGPVLNPDDPEKSYAEGASIQVPMEFWKVIMCVSEEDGKRVKRAYGFIFDQSDPIRSRGFEKMDMSDFEIQQQPLAEISRKTGVVFHSSVLAADVLREGGHNESLRGPELPRIKCLEQIVLR